jgi:hypothetical protein
MGIVFEVACNFQETPLTHAFPVVVAAKARTAKEPVSSPATAAPAITAFDGLIITVFVVVSPADSFAAPVKGAF